jgi:hypothetical protein
VLSAADQERFSRHLLLDAFGGAGQERLCAGAVSIDLPEAFIYVAKSCARALAAAGVGALVLRSEAIAAECKRLSPSLEIVSDVHEVKTARIIFVSIQHDPNAIDRILLEAEAPESPAEASALGALAALEAMKLLSNTGTRAPLPLRVFPLES